MSNPHYFNGIDARKWRENSSELHHGQTGKLLVLPIKIGKSQMQSIAEQLSKQRTLSGNGNVSQSQ